MRFIQVLVCVFWISIGFAAEPRPLADFNAPKPFEKPSEKSAAALVSDHAEPGKKTLKLGVGDGATFTEQTGMPSNWAAYDLVKIDVVNPGAKAVQVYIQVRDGDNSSGYWSWHNRYTAAAPGKSTLQFAVADTWRGEILRREVKGMLDTKNIRQMYVSVMNGGELYFGNLRLEAFPIPRIDVPGLRAFDVEPFGAPGFPAFTPLTEKDDYNKASGYGWTQKKFANINPEIAIRLHPDNLFRDWLSFYSGELAIDVPNGKYRVHAQISDPSAWELLQWFTQRSISAEGKTVVEETMNAAQFMDSYFRNQDCEDLPGEDPFEKYVESRHPWHTFDVDVADGQLNLTFASKDTYGMTLSALVVYPLAEQDKGRQFMEFTKGMRRFDWSQQWKPVSVPPAAPAFSGKMADEAKANGFVLFSSSIDADVSYDRVPQDDEQLQSLTLSVPRGELDIGLVAMRPAQPLGKVEVSVAPLKNAQGGAIAAENISVRVGRYQVSRYQGEQTGLYAVKERQFRPFNTNVADALRCDDGMARRFLLTVRVPADAAPGEYHSEITIKSEKSGARKLPFTVNVLPFKLPEPQHLFGVYATGVLPVPYYPEIKADLARRMEIVYRDLRDHGINHMEESRASVDWRDGKAVITNPEVVEADYALRTKYGFKTPVAQLPSGATREQLSKDQPIRGMPRAQFIQNWHKELTDFYLSRGWPHPYFCYGDEPILPVTLNELTAINNACHAVSPEIWLGIAYHTDDRVKETFELAKTLDVHHLKAFCPVSSFDEVKKTGKLLMHSNVGKDRLPYGLREWRATLEKKTDGCITYAYLGIHVDIYYGLDAREDDYILAPPRKDGTLVTTPSWERIREGTTDYRYARALQNIVDDAASVPAQAAAAKALLQEAFDIGGLTDSREATRRSAEWRTKAQKALAQPAK